MKVNMKQLEEAYFHTRVLTPKQYELDDQPAQHLRAAPFLRVPSDFVEPQRAEPTAVTHAPAVHQDHQATTFPLTDVAKAVNTSTFYFCKTV